MREDSSCLTFLDINHSKILYDPSPKVMEIKAKINKWDLIKLKSFCTTKETIRSDQIRSVAQSCPTLCDKQGEKTAFRMGENISK